MPAGPAQHRRRTRWIGQRRRSLSDCPHRLIVSAPMPQAYSRRSLPSPRHQEAVAVAQPGCVRCAGGCSLPVAAAGSLELAAWHTAHRLTGTQPQGGSQADCWRHSARRVELHAFAHLNTAAGWSSHGLAVSSSGGRLPQCTQRQVGP